MVRNRYTRIRLAVIATLLSVPWLSPVLVMADDVPCTNSSNGNGTHACTAHLTGTTAPNQTTWDSHGNGHSGGNGGSTDSLNFSLTSATQLSDYQIPNAGSGFSPLDIRATGGGPTGQAGACRMGIARALVSLDQETCFPPLRDNGFLTRDSRMKERKHYGLRGARRGTQFSKR